MTPEMPIPDFYLSPVPLTDTNPKREQELAAALSLTPRISSVLKDCLAYGLRSATSARPAFQFACLSEVRTEGSYHN